MNSIGVLDRPRAITRSAVRLGSWQLLGFGLLAALMSLGHIRHGGFYYDDWGALSLARFGGQHALWQYYGTRPGQVFYYGFLESVLGYHASLQLAWAALALVVEAGLVTALLVRLGLGPGHATSIGALLIVFPFSDSVWLWSIVSMASVAISLGIGGVLVALRAFERQSVPLHAASVVLFVASVLSYEVFAVAGCLIGVLYVLRVGWRGARLRWAIDIVAIAGALAIAKLALPIDVATPSGGQSPAGMLDHTGSILAHGWTLLGAAVFPFATGPLAAGVAVGIGLLAVTLRRRAVRAELGRWLAVGGAGVVVALAGWAVYVPASGHYVPVIGGTLNRVNALAAIGLVMIAYATWMLVGVIVRRPRAIAICAVLAIGGGYLVRAESDARRWDRAASAQRQLLTTVQSLVPRPARSATIYVFDHPAAVDGIPVLGTQLDLTSALRLTYGDGSLVGVPLSGVRRPACAGSLVVDVDRGTLRQCSATR
jgi:hypothetical protein